MSLLAGKTKILVAPNAFKECAGPVETAELIKNFLLKKADSLNITVIPLSDGGDGFVDVCNYNYAGKTVRYKIHSLYCNELIDCPVGYSEQQKAFYVESANTIGLKLIPPAYRQPLLLSSKPMGELLLKIKSDVLNGNYKAEEVIIGIGGTGTNDMGLGMLSLLGLELYNSQTKKLEPIPENFININSFVWKPVSFPFKIKLVVDVDNPLTGELGASRVFGPQKGATELDVAKMEEGFLNFISVIKKIKPEILSGKLLGAGGGITAGFTAFLGAQVVFAKDFILNDLGASKHLDADYVITGEGSFDEQSIGNKGPGVVIDFFAGKNKKIFLITGSMKGERTRGYLKNVEIEELSAFFGSKEESIRNFRKGVELALSSVYGKLGLERP